MTTSVSRQPQLILTPFVPDMLSAVHEVFYRSVHGCCHRDYTAPQLAAWAPYNWNKAQWQQRLMALQVVVAWREQQAVGFGSLQPVYQPPALKLNAARELFSPADTITCAYLDHLFVHPDYQRCKVAQSICEQIEQLASDLSSVRSVLLFTDASLTSAGFFQHRGFKILTRQEAACRGQLLTNFTCAKLIS